MNIHPGPLEHGVLLSKLQESYTEGFLEGKEIHPAPPEQSPLDQSLN